VSFAFQCYQFSRSGYLGFILETRMAAMSKKSAFLCLVSTENKGNISQISSTSWQLLNRGSGGSVESRKWVQPLHMFQQFIDEVDVVVDQLISWFRTSVVAGLVSLPAFHHHHHLESILICIWQVVQIEEVFTEKKSEFEWKKGKEHLDNEHVPSNSIQYLTLQFYHPKFNDEISIPESWEEYTSVVLHNPGYYKLQYQLVANLSISSRFSNSVEYRFLKYDLRILWISSLSVVIIPISFLILLIWMLSLPFGLNLIISLHLFLLADFASSISRAFSFNLVNLSIGESGVLKSPTVNVWGLMLESSF
ncbi:hypothetical protein STEG23_024305, partial [Scotinomys teguina]